MKAKEGRPRSTPSRSAKTDGAAQDQGMGEEGGRRGKSSTRRKNPAVCDRSVLVRDDQLGHAWLGLGVGLGVGLGLGLGLK